MAIKDRVLVVGLFLNVFLYIGIVYGLFLDLTVGYFHWFRFALWRTWLVHFVFISICGVGVYLTGAFLLVYSFYLYLAVMIYFALSLVVLLKGGFEERNLIMKGDQEVALIQTRAWLFSTVNCIISLPHRKKVYYEVLSDELTGLKVLDSVGNVLLVSIYTHRPLSGVEEAAVEIDFSDEVVCRAVERRRVDYEIRPDTYLSLFLRKDGVTVEKVT